MKILIADDERLIVDDLSSEVRDLFPEAVIDGVTGSEAALRLAEEKDYDVAILDIDMPGMDGLSLARRIIAMQPYVNIIFVTGYKEYAYEALELYCSAFLLKPAGRAQLKKAFENLRKPFLDISQDYYAEHYRGGDVIGRKLSALREQRGMSRQELADLMDVSRQTVFRWEHGERIPDVLTFIRITRLLGVEVGDVLGIDV